MAPGPGGWRARSVDPSQHSHSVPHQRCPNGLPRRQHRAGRATRPTTPCSSQRLPAAPFSGNRATASRDALGCTPTEKHQSAQLPGRRPSTCLSRPRAWAGRHDPRANAPASSRSSARRRDDRSRTQCGSWRGGHVRRTLTTASSRTQAPRTSRPRNASWRTRDSHEPVQDAPVASESGRESRSRPRVKRGRLHEVGSAGGGKQTPALAGFPSAPGEIRTPDLRFRRMILGVPFGSKTLSL